MDMKEILRQISELESQLTIRKTKTEQLKQDLKYSTMEQQKELNEVNRLQQCNESMRTKQETEKRIIQEQINEEDFSKFIDLLSDNIF